MTRLISAVARLGLGLVILCTTLISIATPASAESQVIQLSSYLSAQIVQEPNSESVSIRLVPVIPNSVFGERAFVGDMIQNQSYVGNNCTAYGFSTPCSFSVRPSGQIRICLWLEAPAVNQLAYSCRTIVYGQARVASAPIELQARASANKALISFEQPSNEDAYLATNYSETLITNYEYSLDGGRSWAAASPAQTTSPLLIDGLSNGTNYSVKLRAVNAVGSGDVSNAVSVTPYTTASAPSLVAVHTGNKRATADFSTPTETGGSSITNYEYSVDNGATWKAATPAQTTSPLVITGLTNGTRYSVRVRPVNAAGTGAESNSLSVTPQNVATEPQISSIIAGDQMATVNFVAPSQDGGMAVTNYEFSTDNGTTWTASSPAQTTSPIVLRGLTNGSQYAVKLRAVNGAVVEKYRVLVGVNYPPNRRAEVGDVVSDFPELALYWCLAQQAIERQESYGTGAESNSVLVKPVAPATAPTISRSTSGNGQVSFGIVAPIQVNDSALTGYDYSTNNGSTWSHFASVDGPFVITGLTNGTAYQVKVRAVNSAGPGAASVAVTVTPTNLVPAVPTISSVTAGNQLADVSIAQPTGITAQSITGYQYNINGSLTWASCVMTSNACRVNGLPNGAKATIKVRAVNANGVSPASAKSYVTPVTTSQSPTISTITPSAGALTVAFIPPADNGGSKVLRYEYSVNGGAWVNPVKPIAKSPFTVTGLANATSYAVRVRAVTAVGNGEVSTSVSGSTPAVVASAPTITTALAGKTSITVNFTAPSNNGGAAVTNYAYSVDGKTWTTLSPASVSTQIVITGLTSYKTYSVKIRAINSAGLGAISTGQSVKTLK